MSKKNKNENGSILKNGPARGESERKPIDLALPGGEWWRPWEDGDDEITLTIKKVKSGQYGDYLVGIDREGNIWFVNLHAMLDALRRFVGRTVEIRYLGFDPDQGRNGVHQYEASEVRRRSGRLARGPSRPVRPTGEGTEETEEALDSAAEES